MPAAVRSTFAQRTRTPFCGPNLRRSAEVQAAEQRKENERRLELMAARLKNESERQMRERGTQLREENVRQLGEILGPLRNGIQEMRHAVQQADSRHLDSMSRLDEKH